MSFMFVSGAVSTPVAAMVVLLLAAAAWSWLVALGKVNLLLRLRHMNADFERRFWAAESLSPLAQEVSRAGAPHPLASVFLLGMEEYGRIAASGQPPPAEGWRRQLGRLMEVELGRACQPLERHMAALGAVGMAALPISAAVALFRLAEGFFASSLLSGWPSPQVFGEASLIVASGLFAAVPSLAGGRAVAGEIRRRRKRMEGFIVEFSTVLARRLARERGG